MEWIKARGALKSSFFSEISMLSATHQHDDVFGLAANATCDDFSVDDLLDFSDKNFEENSFQEEDDEGKGSFSESSQERSFVYNQEFGALPEGELAVPVDDIENLEWLSHFVDDSIMEVSLLCQGGNFKEKNICFVKKQSEVITRESYFSSPVCRKPRGKRARPSGRVVWRVGSPSSTSEASMSSSSHGISLVSSCVLDSIEENDSLFSIEKPPCKKYKKKTNGDTDYGTCVSQMLRRCTHCQVQKTPQWRTGPLGPKTLCNACGVRFKSGRLFPEYRPACSPTFSQEVHSNSHKKVLEMREKKEMVIIPDDSLPSSCCSLDSNLISV